MPLLPAGGAHQELRSSVSLICKDKGSISVELRRTANVLESSELT
jgi:hypothetical protein